MANETVIEDLIWPLRETILQSIEPLITIFEIVGIAILVYIIFLILRALFRWRTMRKVVKMAKHVEQIDHKMDVLIEKIDKINVKEKEAIKIKKEKIKKGKNPIK